MLINTYATMMMQKPDQQRWYCLVAAPAAILATSTTAEKMMKPYFSSLPRKPQCLNFKANMGISATSSQQLMKMPNITNGVNHRYCSSNGAKPTMSEPQKRALAGVGNPMNEVV